MRKLLYFFILSSTVQAFAQTEVAQLASSRQITKKETANLDSQDVRYLPLFGSREPYKSNSLRMPTL
jgi:hypothetical protein